MIFHINEDNKEVEVKRYKTKVSAMKDLGLSDNGRDSKKFTKILNREEVKNIDTGNFKWKVIK